MTKRYAHLGLLLVFMMVLIVSCQPQVVEVTVEVTRVVTETVTEVVEGETVVVEVTRIVVEEAVVEEEMLDEPVEATGSEEGEPSPFQPGSGQKLVVTRVSGDGWVDSSAAPAEAAVADNTTRAENENTVVVPQPAAETSMLSTEVAAENVLTAAEVDDNAQWEMYLAYLEAYEGLPIIEMDVRERHEIEILDANGAPVLAAELTFIDPEGEIVYRLRTHSDGRAYFFPNLLAPEFQHESYTVNVLADHTQLIDTFTLQRNGELEQRWLRETDYVSVAPLATKIDIFFVIDATGSMGDEIKQLKENMTAIAARLDALETSSLVRYGMTVYRDRGDEFTSQTYQFTADVEAFAAALAEVEAAGGGDYPEDMHEGLQKSLQVADWSINNTISLMFVIGDAPPHLDYEDQVWTYDVAALEAAVRGIKMFPIASSGLDEQGEYIYRQLAQVTGGKFLFLTYGAAGAGTLGNNTDLTVNDYDVTSLDGLITKIIEEELSFQGRS